MSSSETARAAPARSAAELALALLLAAGAALAGYTCWSTLAHDAYLREHLGGAALLAPLALALASLLALGGLAALVSRRLACPGALLGLWSLLLACAWLAVLLWLQPPRALLLE